MKKILFGFAFILAFCGQASATHLFRNNAANINSGILPNARLDSSSVTLQGNALSISTIAKGVNDIITGAQTVGGVDVSSVGMGVNNLNASTGTIVTTIQTSTAILNTKIDRLARTSSIVIGTSESSDPDIVGTDENAFHTAISCITSKGTIYVQKGNYQIKGVTVPPTVEIVFESSAVVHNSGGNKIFDSSGVLRNLQLVVNGSIQNKGFGYIKLNSGSRTYGTTVIRADLGAGAIDSGIFWIVESTNVLIDGIVNHVYESTQATNNAYARYFIRNSTDVYIKNIVDIGSVTNKAFSDDYCHFRLSSGIVNLNISNSIFKTNTQFVNALNTRYLSGFIMNDCAVYVASMAPTSANYLFYMFSQNGHISTGTVFNDINIVFDGITDGQTVDSIFFIQNADGVSISNVNVSRIETQKLNGATNFIKVTDTTGKSTRVYNCNVWAVGTFLSDSGLDTKRGANNWLNGIKQTVD